MKLLPVFIAGLISTLCSAARDTMRIEMTGGVIATIDVPQKMKYKKTMLVFYALPNGNSTAQTMGGKPQVDWRYDIQHIRAQTIFIRNKLKSNLVVVYLENDIKSWPQWRRLRNDNPLRIKHMIDSISAMFKGKVSVHLNGHSGGGSLIFGYLNSVNEIPFAIKRISFIDSNYAYDSSYAQKILKWLQSDKANHLDVFAYNDSVALLDGKPFVSATGGTWYRSHRMMEDLQSNSIQTVSPTGIQIFMNRTGNIHFYLKPNPDRKIYHTQQVALNGFIHSVLCGTKKHEKKYVYYGDPAYTQFIE